jgi:anti-anti-sigma factor
LARPHCGTTTHRGIIRRGADKEGIGQVDVRSEPAGTAVVYRISGKLDAVGGPKLDSAITKDASARVILDMREVAYISSAGLRVIIQTAKRAQAAKGGVAAFGLQASVREVFEVAGLESIVPIASDEVEARAKLGA